MSTNPNANPAETAAQQALKRVLNCIEQGRSFRLEAGAGAGKTYSLINALQMLITTRGPALLRNNQQIACITYTNVAKEEIESRIDRHPAVRSDTVHSFCWSILKDFQGHLRQLLPSIDKWKLKIEEFGSISNQKIVYDLGYMKINRDFISLRHDDVLKLMSLSLSIPKFRMLLSIRHPIIFIDEYQDTDTSFVQAIKDHFLETASGPMFGFFGDHWQKIYGLGCGKIEHANVEVIDKGANFRSVGAVVTCLNRMRPELRQVVSDPLAPGEVHVFHTNSWDGERLTGSHWKGDTPANVAHDYLELVRTRLHELGWDFSAQRTKILMLTHNVLANEQGYPTIAKIYQFNDQFLKKEDAHIAFLADVIEPVCAAYEKKRYGDMLVSLPGKLPAIVSHSSKLNWSKMMEGLLVKRHTATVGAVIDYLLETNLLPVPEAVREKAHQLAEWRSENDQEEPESLKRLRALREVSYQEIIALDRFIDGYTPFATKHGVKGEEFENVLVVIGRGWNQYDFDQMLAWACPGGLVPENKKESFERNRNLFYVACSRPKVRLALLFTQLLSVSALATLRYWFGSESIIELPAAV